MRTIHVNGNTVTLRNNNLRIQFDRNFGGAALHWNAMPSGVQLVNPFPGEACNLVYDTGNDGTQASPDGLTSNYITPIDEDHEYTRYYGLETCLQKSWGDTGTCRYSTAGYLPYFWASLERVDDCIPPDPRGDHGWNTQYHNFLNLPASVFSNPGVPLVFAARPGVPSGMILIGDEIKQYYIPSTPWNQAYCKIKNGNAAMSVNVNMRLASEDAVAGIIFRKQVPSHLGADINALYQSPGYQLNINKQGGMAFVKDNVEVLWSKPPAFGDLLNGLAGLNVEIRSTPDSMADSAYIYVNNQFVGIAPLAYKFDAMGLFASCSSGQIWFNYRRPFDLNVIGRSSFNAYDDKMSMYFSVETEDGSTIPFYRTNLPVIFLDYAIRKGYTVKNKAGAKYSDLSPNFADLETAPGVLDTTKVSSIWIGTDDRSAGLYFSGIAFGKTPNVTGRPHIGISKNHIAFNALGFEANNVPEAISKASMSCWVRSAVPVGW